MNLGTVDLSMLPAGLAWALVVIVLVCHVLPDVITLTGTPKTSPQPSTAGTSSAQPSPTTKSSVA